jgi:Ser/Thr protein kinase RdoA (MazF antagonist)
LTKLADGASAEVYAWGEDRVLKLFRPGFPREAIEKELRHARIAHGLGIATPRPDGMAYVEGRPGIIFERCEGPTLYELLVTGREQPEKLAALLFDAQQSMHHLQCTDLPPLEERFARRILRARDVPDPYRQRALDTVRELSTERRVCHGDLHPINVVLSPAGAMIIDWLDAGCGDPAAEVVRSLLIIEHARIKAIDAPVRRAFLAAYWSRCRQAWADRLERLDRWRVPMAIVRLAESRDDNERQQLMRVVMADGKERKDRPPPEGSLLN